MTDQRIKLAEFVGWKWVFGSGSLGYWLFKGMKTDWIEVDQRHTLLPDPRNDANDCEALMAALWDTLGIVTSTHIGEFHAAETWDGVKWDREDGSPDDGFNYKHGVCDLAEKVIDSKQERHGLGAYDDGMAKLGYRSGSSND